MKMKDIFETQMQIETSRLCLRPITLKDAPAIYEIFSDPLVMKFYDVLPHTALSQTKALIENFQESYLNQKGIRWGITLKGKDEVIGTCGFHHISLVNKRAEVDYELKSSMWRQGIMYETLQAIVQFGFKTWGLNRIEALIELENKASQNLLSKVGFTKEGILKQYEFCRGELIDLCMYALIQSEYRGCSSRNK